MKTPFLHPPPNLGEATYSPAPSAHPLEAIGGPPSGGSSASSRAFHCPDIAPIPDQVADDTPTSRLFFDRWAPKIAATASIEELNEVTSLLTTDWHKLTSNENEDRGKQNIKPRPPRPAAVDPSTKRRTQSRQQQRIKRQSNKARNSNASKLQRLFIRYPRRAVRKVLGDISQPYTGTVEAATEFLKGTYTCPRPSPDRIVGARQAYDQCEWARPSQEELSALSSPPSKEEISVKIKRATNTAPGADGIEYHDIAKLDPNGELLEVLYDAVWRLGIPAAWKVARTIPIFKKGDPADFGNFRPISLLSTLYKLFSGVIASRLCTVASNNEWLSAEQKGFLPGAHGIQEHSMLLETAIGEAKHLKGNLTICWLDLANAFGSLPHDFLEELFVSLPIPIELQSILADIYQNNISQFVVGQDVVPIASTSGVRQGDGLSSVIFNLAAEPLIRSAKKTTNEGFPLFSAHLKVTAYADDISLVGSRPEILQRTLDDMCSTATSLGLRFNGAKCAAISFSRGKVDTSSPLLIDGKPIRTLDEGDNETYLGVPIGSRLLFRPATSLQGNLTKVIDSDLAPWQKLEVFRSHLIPSVSHHLATGRVEKSFLTELDRCCADFLRVVANVPHNAHSDFLYADRRAGGLGASRLTEDADVWTISRAAQLMDSNDEVVRTAARSQASKNVYTALKIVPTTEMLSQYLSGSQKDGFYNVRFASTGTNTWSRARRASTRLGVQIDVSSDDTKTLLVADDVSVSSVKAVRGLRSVIRARHTTALCAAPHQGAAARGLTLDTKHPDMTRLISSRTTLNFEEWNLIHQARLGILPLHGVPGYQPSNKSCRRCGCPMETTAHVLNACPNGMAAMTERHDGVLARLAKSIEKAGHTTRINRSWGEDHLRPDLVITSMDPITIIDVTVPFDEPANLLAAHARKVQKYSHLGSTLPFVVGSLGSWLPTNDLIATTLGISPRTWNSVRRDSRLLAIRGSLTIARQHIRCQKDSTTPENFPPPSSPTDQAPAPQ